MTEIKVYHYKIYDGIEVLILPVSWRKALAIGFWAKVGSVNEPPEYQGLSHFLEHTVFRGTRNLSSRQIVENIEKLGGTIDAYTSKEETCFFTTLLGEYFETGIMVLSELVSAPRLADEDIERERKVILTEIADNFDDPDSLAQDLFTIALFGNSPVGRPILGTKTTVGRIDGATLRAFWRNTYSDGNLLIGAYGNVDPEKFMETFQKYFTPPEPDGTFTPQKPAFSTENDGKFILVPGKFSQVHFFIGTRTFPFENSRRYPLALLDTIMGRGSSSRLFQKIREEMGLVYTIQSFSDLLSITGLWAVYGATSRDNLKKLAETIYDEFRRIGEEGPSPEELENAKNFLKGKLFLNSEGLWSNLSRTIESYRYTGRVIPIDETVEKVMAVSAEEIAELARELLRPENLVALAFGDIPDDLPDLPMEFSRRKIEDLFPEEFRSL